MARWGGPRQAARVTRDAGFRLSLSVSMIRRPALAFLLDSSASLSRPPAAVVVAGQSGDRLALPQRDWPIPDPTASRPAQRRRNPKPGSTALP